MTLENAIKKLSKVAKIETNGLHYWGQIGGHMVEFMKNSVGDISCIRVRGVRDEDDIMTDYFAGVWCDNLSQAIRIASR